MAVALTYDKLDETQKKNAALINAALTKYGITNPYLRAGILAVVAKESAFTPIAEGYRYTIPRLRVVFSTERLQNKSNNDLIKLLKVQPANAGYGLKPADQGRATELHIICLILKARLERCRMSCHHHCSNLRYLYPIEHWLQIFCQRKSSLFVWYLQVHRLLR